MDCIHIRLHFPTPHKIQRQIARLPSDTTQTTLAANMPVNLNKIGLNNQNSQSVLSTRKLADRYLSLLYPVPCPV